MPLVPGQQLFDKYRIEHLLGQGGFGIVYLARDTLLERPVAIKELNAGTQAEDVAFKRFLQEARAAGSLDNSHIVTVHALEVEPSGTHYLFMEYLPGGSLRALLEKRGRLSVDNAVSIATDVCRGLAAAHAKGIVHRDVKPENILLTDKGRAKVGDFGIAHVPPPMGKYTLARTGFQPGTLPYMSPEQLRGQEVDGRSDVYEVGLLLYEMLTGQPCVDWESLCQEARAVAGSNVARFQVRLHELLEVAICKEEPARLSQVRPDVPAWLEQILARALAKQVDDRPTAMELAKALLNKGAVRPGRSVSTARTGVESAEVHLTRAVSYHQQGLLDEAIREYQAALRLSPDNATVHCNLGGIYCQKGQWDDAIREFQAALRIDPDDAEVHYNLGKAYEQQSRWDEAILEHEAVLRLSPSHSRARHSLDVASERRARTSGNGREPKSAPRVVSDTAPAPLNLGGAYGQQSRWDEAIREYEAGLRIDPDNAEAHYGWDGSMDSRAVWTMKSVSIRPRCVSIRTMQIRT